MKELTVAQNAALEKWAETVEEHSLIKEFIDWASGEGLLSARWSFARSDVLDKFHGIDRRNLESGRKVLAEGARAEAAP